MDTPGQAGGPRGGNGPGAAASHGAVPGAAAAAALGLEPSLHDFSGYQDLGKLLYLTEPQFCHLGNEIHLIL